MSKEIVLTDEEMSKFEDEESCFGHKDPDVGYCDTEDCCKECPFAKKCKAICIDKKTPVLETENDTASEKAVDTPRTEEEVDRPYILALVQSVCESHDMKPEIKNSTTRDKVFIGEDDVFVVTNRALKINRLEDESKLGIADSYWKESNKGVTINYTPELDWEKVISNALDRLYIESITKPEEKPKENLFGGVEPDTKPDTKPIAEKPSKKAEKKAEPVASEEEFVPEDIDYGEVKKSLQIIEYANGYTEVRVISKASVEKILERISGLIG
jgi:hypothetical protein